MAEFLLYAGLQPSEYDKLPQWKLRIIQEKTNEKLAADRKRNGNG